MGYSKRIYTAAAAASLTVAALAIQPANAAGSLGRIVTDAGKPAHIVHVHSRHDDHYEGRRRTHHHRHHRHVVDAPFTHVETGRRVHVDAPFARVTVDKQGRHIRAPFVNLWLPR